MAPLGAITPITLKGTFLIITVFPTGSSPQPKRLWATLSPRTHTASALSISLWVKKVPLATDQLLTI